MKEMMQGNYFAQGVCLINLKNSHPPCFAPILHRFSRSFPAWFPSRESLYFCFYLDSLPYLQ